MSDGGGEAPEEQEAAVEEEKKEETVAEAPVEGAAAAEEGGEAAAEGEATNAQPAEGDGEDPPVATAAEGEAPADDAAGGEEGEAAAEGDGENPPAEGEEGAPAGDNGPSIEERIEKDPLELELLEPLPEQVIMGALPRITEMMSEWRKGMRAVEDAFADHVEAMHQKFDEKSKMFEKIQT